MKCSISSQCTSTNRRQHTRHELVFSTSTLRCSLHWAQHSLRRTTGQLFNTSCPRLLILRVTLQRVTKYCLSAVSSESSFETLSGYACWASSPRLLPSENYQK